MRSIDIYIINKIIVVRIRISMEMHAYTVTISKKYTKVYMFFSYNHLIFLTALKISRRKYSQDVNSG